LHIKIECHGCPHIKSDPTVHHRLSSHEFTHTQVRYVLGERSGLSRHDLLQGSSQPLGHESLKVMFDNYSIVMLVNYDDSIRTFTLKDEGGDI
jgi:hypothetical protein